MPSFSGVSLAGDTISYRPGLRKETHPVAGVSAYVDTAGGIDRRLSATRTAGGAFLLGPVGMVLGAVAKKRVSDQQTFLIVEGPDFAWAVEIKMESGMGAGRVNAKRAARARKFAAKITTAGK